MEINEEVYKHTIFAGLNIPREKLERTSKQIKELLLELVGAERVNEKKMGGVQRLSKLKLLCIYTVRFL